MIKYISVYIMPIFILLNAACRFGNPGDAVYAPEEIFSSDGNFNGYLAQNLDLLTENFIAYDVDGKVISKLYFLKQLTTDQYLFIKLSSNDNKLYFKLYKLKPGNERAHGDVMYAYLHSYYEHYQQVGKKFPDFNFTDINGTQYTSQNTKGKIVIIKCWFIKCQACNEEMPKLNAIVKKYKNRKDIVFISLATDKKAELKDFLKNKDFEYPVVAEQENFISNQLKTNEYPTHYIINKQGIVVNVVDKPEEVEYTLVHDL